MTEFLVYETRNCVFLASSSNVTQRFQTFVITRRHRLHRDSAGSYLNDAAVLGGKSEIGRKKKKSVRTVKSGWRTAAMATGDSERTSAEF